MRVAAIVPAAGKGRRIKSEIEKPYIELKGRPIIVHTLLKITENRHINEIIVAVRKEMIGFFRDEIIGKHNIKNVKLVNGGRERKDSVFNALRNVSQDIDYILIHDCVRPFITNRLIDSSLKEAKRFGASVTAVPVKPTLKYVTKDGCILDTPDRSNLWEAQTPQTFKRDLIERAYKELGNKRTNITDDSMLVERIGVKPRIVLGSYSNIKITTKEDLELAKILLNC